MSFTGASQQYNNTVYQKTEFTTNSFYTSPYIHHVVVTSLKPRTIYYYSVGGLGADASSRIISFNTGR